MPDPVTPNSGQPTSTPNPAAPAGAPGSAPAPLSVNFSELFKDEAVLKNLTNWAESTVAAPLRAKNEEILREKQKLSEQFEALKKQVEGNDVPAGGKPQSTTAPTGKYTQEDLKKILDEKEKEFTGKLTESSTKADKLMGKVRTLLIDNELSQKLAQAGAKPEAAKILATYLKQPHDNGGQRLKIEEEPTTGEFKLVILDEKGAPRWGKNGPLTMDEFVMEAREQHKAFFSAPATGGSGSLGSVMPRGLGGFTHTYEQYLSLSPGEQAKIPIEQVAPRRLG